MAYEPTVWQSGDVVTSAKLNKLENGVAAAGGTFVLHETIDGATHTLDHTWQEIHDAIAGGAIPIVAFADETFTSISLVLNAYYDTEKNAYVVIIGNETYSADSANGYPVYDEDSPG